jgi:uncharacterized Tic20 family protein
LISTNAGSTLAALSLQLPEKSHVLHDKKSYGVIEAPGGITVRLMEATRQVPTIEERKIAVLAHASILLTFLVSVTTGGLGVLAVMLVPLFIWFYYRDRSSYIASHALQATAYQVALLILFLALTLALGLVLATVWVITGLLSIILVGLILVPVAGVLTLLAGLVLAAFPLVGLAYGLVAAWEVYNERDFRYRWLADWLETRQLA